MLNGTQFFVGLFALIPIASISAESICYGKVNAGKLENGVQLPQEGINFSAYSALGSSIGRTYVHERIRDVVVETYSRLAKTNPDKAYVYGETGWKHGGRIRPHKTHQNGLSVDFMVPVMDESGRSVKLPTSMFNKYGYGINFDEYGKSDDLKIDFDAIAEHLKQLQVVAREKHVDIALVIFDQSLRPALFKTNTGAQLENSLPWMKGNAWIKHDQHYHVDFSIPCEPMKN